MKKNKYELFCDFLKEQEDDEDLTFTVNKIKENNGGYLPPSAERYQAFWSNYKQYWLEAGYEAINVLRPDDKGNLTVTFHKVSEPKNHKETKKPDENINEKNNESRCTNCGKAIKKDFDFCPYCGEPKIKKCPDCGTVLKEDFKFCPKCGKNLVLLNDAQNNDTETKIHE